ncbi:MAG: bifunctional enoyl-CoA hydratase/phosphate acetyltransferase [Clostridia bacterium]
MNSLDQLFESVDGSWKPTIAVVAAHDDYVLASLRTALDMGLADSILLGDIQKIKRIAADQSISLDGFELINVTDKAESSAMAVSLVRQGRAQILMKGLVDTSIILKAALNHETGIRDSDVMSHVGVFEIDGFDRLLYITDAAISIQPDVHAKKRIIENSLQVTRAFENNHPIVACLCAVENVNPKMPATLDASELVRMNKAGELTGCTVTGPLALDNALFREAALRKGINDPNAGLADVLLVPQIDAGNILYKSFTYVAKAKSAGIVVGAKVPIVMTSRVDSDETKLYSIALAIRMAVLTGRTSI